MTEQLEIPLKRKHKKRELMTRDRAIAIMKDVVEGYAGEAIAQRHGYKDASFFISTMKIGYLDARRLAKQGMTAEQIVDTIPRFKVLESVEPSIAEPTVQDLRDAIQMLLFIAHDAEVFRKVNGWLLEEHEKLFKGQMKGAIYYE